MKIFASPQTLNQYHTALVRGITWWGSHMSHGDVAALARQIYCKHKCKQWLHQFTSPLTVNLRRGVHDHSHFWTRYGQIGRSLFINNLQTRRWAEYNCSVGYGEPT